MKLVSTIEEGIKNQKSLRTLSLGTWLQSLAVDYSLIVIAFVAAYFWGWPAYPLSLLLLGIAQHRISILGHDGAHGLICRNKKLNYWLAQLLCFWPQMTDINAYRNFHWEHHKHTGEEDEDPELPLKGDMYHLPLTRKQLYARFVFDLFGASLPEFIQVVTYFSKRGNPFWPISFIVVFGSLSYFTGHPEFFILFMVSKPTTFWAVFRLRIYGEHVGTTGTHRIHLKLWQRFLFAPHYVWMHWEHHKQPSIPYWQLPALRARYTDVPIISFEELISRSVFDNPNEVRKRETVIEKDVWAEAMH